MNLATLTPLNWVIARQRMLLSNFEVCLGWKPTPMIYGSLQFLIFFIAEIIKIGAFLTWNG